jgi:hypothetical protein
MSYNSHLSKLLNPRDSNRKIDSYFPQKAPSSTDFFKERKPVDNKLYSFDWSSPGDSFASQKKSAHPLDQKLLGPIEKKKEWDFGVHNIAKEQPKLGEEHDLISITKIKKKTAVVEDSFDNVVNKNGYQTFFDYSANKGSYNNKFLFNNQKPKFPLYQKQEKYSLSRKEVYEREEEEKAKNLLQYIKEKNASKALLQVSKDLNQTNIVGKDLNEKIMRENQEKEKRDTEIKNKLKDDVVKARMLEIANKNKEEQEKIRKIAKKVEYKKITQFLFLMNL